MNAYTHKINYYETDKMGVTHHSNYVRFMEEARIYFLDSIGCSYAKMEETGVISPVVGIEVNYKKTTTFADVLEIVVGVEKISPCKLSLTYDFKLGDTTVCTAKSSHCFLDGTGRPVIFEKQFPEVYKILKDMCAEANK